MIETYNDDNYAEIVDYSKYNYPDSESDKYWMEQTALIPFLVSAIQEQQTQIEELKQQINELKKDKELSNYHYFYELLYIKILTFI